MARHFQVITKLPLDVRKQLEQRLTDKSFSSYRELELWLKGLGYRISDKVLHYYGVRFERRADSINIATAQARAIAEATDGDQALMNEALARLLQERLFSILIDSTPPLSRSDLIRFAKAITALGHSMFEQRRWTSEHRERLSQQQRTAHQKLSSVAHAGGLSERTVDQIRDLLLDIDPFARPTGSAKNPEN